MSINIRKGATDQSVEVRVLDSSTGEPEAAFAYDTSGIALWYRREGGAKVAITPADLAALTTAHADGGVKYISDGYVRIDVPDAAFATGASSVVIGGSATGMVIVAARANLVEYNPQDAVRLGLTALPNAAADAAGGLPVSDAGGLDLDAKLANTHEITAARMGALTDWIDGGRLDLILDAIVADTNELQTDWANGGRLDLIIDAVLADTNELQTDWANGGRLDLLLDAVLEDTGTTLPATLTTIEGKIDTIDGIVDAILVDTAEIGAAGAGLTALASAATAATIAGYIDTEVAAILAAVDTEVAAIKAKTDLIPADPATETTLATLATAAQATAIEADTQDIQGRLPAALTAGGNIKADALAINGNTTAAAQLAKSASVIVSGAAAAGTLSTTQMTTDLTEATDDHYNGRIIIWTSGVLAGQATLISDYTGATKLLTFTAVTEAPSASDSFIIV